ncbi:type I polyketide synthase [Methylocucumis oryzae]|uniref:type I polyketide synthase n=1 Tax=Methylocucumis oryzae TaxID=1632867 RepID=UPI000696488F|nr:type I polyketide synthase [Methylocucumis oryzae]
MSYAEFNAIIEQLRKGEINRAQAEALLTALKPVEITEQESEQQPMSAQPVNTAQIAIIGLSGQFPGAENTEQFWRNLVTGVDAIAELPKCYQTEAPKPGALTQGGYLAKRACFDAWFFNIPPKEAEAMHPHQRLVLQEGWKALEDAGINPKRLANTATGVFIGAEPVAYFHDSFTGSSEAIIASRLAYFLNLKGPALVINTGCSSSGVAIHSACQSLAIGESDLALAGGVFAMLDQHMLNSLTRIGMVAANARCRSFDANADGTVFSEGVGIVVLKRLADALADQDPIYAVITASGINQDGTSNGITAPNGQAQAALIEQLYQRHHINPETISYIEAHGTGTTLGDPVEANALVRAFRQFTDKQAFCALGSAKAHIGHTSASAAVIGLIKLVLSMQHRVLPKLLHFEQLNPLIELAGSPFYLTTETQAWQPSGDNSLLVAALSSFGHSGTNVHLVVSEFIAESVVNKALTEYLIPISAKTPESLRAYAQKLADFLRITQSIDLADLAYTLQIGREAMVERAAFVCTNLTHLQQQLIAFSQGEILTGIYSAVVSEHPVLTDLPAQAALTEIAQVWVEGRLRAWPCWYGEVKPKRIHAPVYQFAEEAYWATAKPVSTIDYLHPLLHKNCSTINGLCYQSDFTGEEFYLAGHCVHGVKVLPGVAHLELAIAALINGLAQSSSFIALELHNVAWLKPLVLKNNGLRIFTRLTPDTAQRFRFTVEGLTDTGETECYSQGLASLLTTVELKSLALTQLRERMAEFMVPVERCYKRFRQAGIVHGVDMSALKTLYCNRENVLAHIVLPETLQASFSQYHWHPSLLDSVLQATIGFSLAAADDSAETVLPFTVEHCQWFKPLQASLWCWLSKTQSLAGIKFDIEICSEDGSVCARLNGFNARPLQVLTRNNSEAPSRQQEYLIAPVWQPLLNAELLRQTLPTPDVVINATPEQLAQLQTWYPSLQAINLPKQASFEQVSELLSGRPIQHLLWFPVNSPDEMPQASVLQLFHLSKALLSLGFAAQPLIWTLITENCASVPGFAIQPSHASVHGFIGSLAKELPNWRLRLLDVDDAAQLNQDLFALTELPAGEVLAYRDSQWWQLVLRPWLSSSSQILGKSWYKQRGVYVVLGGAGGIGMAWSRYVIETYQARVVWLGRKPLTAEINTKLAEFAHYDIPPWYIAADATDKTSLINAYQLIKSRYPDIHGVVHSAIVLQDQSIASMTEPQFIAGLSAKVDTSVNLAEVFGDGNLDFMLFFSSIIAFGKAAGQSNYAAGSTF